MPRRAIGIAMLTALLGIAPAAWAQTSAPKRNDIQTPASGTAPPGTEKWRLTFRGGGSIPNGISTGLSALPPAGLPDNVTFGLADHPVPSWYFGDGAAILNANLRPGAPTLTPLDSVLTSGSLARSSGPAFGVTLSRSLTPRYRLEVSLDANWTGPTFTSRARTAIESTRASFDDAFSSFLASPILQSPSVSSVATVANGQRLEWLVSGAVDVVLRRTARNEWHATIGAGIVSDAGSGPTATLDGSYAFTLKSRAFAEEDRVTVTLLRAQRPFVLVGGGWARNLSRRWGLSADLRVALSGPGETTQISTNPSITHDSPPDVPTIVTGPGLPTVIFGNFNGGSSLGTVLPAFTTFVATGVQVRAELTAGLFLRF